MTRRQKSKMFLTHILFPFIQEVQCHSKNQAQENVDSFSRLIKRKNTVIKYLNHLVLIPCLCEQELGEFFIDQVLKGTKGAEAVVSRLERLGPSVMPQFLNALEAEYQHLGHEYILCLLTDEVYADLEEVRISSKIRERIHSLSVLDQVKLGLQLKTALIPHLMTKHLLTEDEENMLLNNGTELDRNSTLLDLLDTKGPTAHLLFVECLKAEDSHRTHLELYNLICGGEERQIPDVASSSINRKRKASHHSKVSVTKRHPDRLKIDGKLDKDEYLNVIQKVRSYHLHGEWDAVDRIVEESAKKSKDFNVAVLLESCTGFITQQQGDKVKKTVERARKLCSHITNNCYFYLKGRCEWTLAKLYRYTKELPKALHCIRTARQIQYNVRAGEDTALTNYCYGCILLETLAAAKKYDPEMEKEAQKSLELAIAHASSGDYGLDLSHPKIRLAQLYIGSSSHLSGIHKNPDRLRKAHASLKSVNFSKLAPRTQCIYYYTECDLNMARGNMDAAICSAKNALLIASQNNFAEEVELVQKRMSHLKFPV